MEAREENSDEAVFAKQNRLLGHQNEKRHSSQWRTADRELNMHGYQVWILKRENQKCRSWTLVSGLNGRHIEYQSLIRRQWKFLAGKRAPKVIVYEPSFLIIYSLTIDYWEKICVQMEEWHTPLERLLVKDAFKFFSHQIGWMTPEFLPWKQKLSNQFLKNRTLLKRQWQQCYWKKNSKGGILSQYLENIPEKPGSCRSLGR